MRPGAPVSNCSKEGFPRVSGDAPLNDYAMEVIGRFSPRERGCAQLCA